MSPRLPRRRSVAARPWPGHRELIPAPHVSVAVKVKPDRHDDIEDHHRAELGAIAEENGKQLEFEKNGKVVAQIPCHWIQLNAKPESDEALINHDSVQEIRFAGRNTAAQID